LKDVSVKIFFIVCGLLLAAAEVFALQPRLEVAELAREADVIVKAQVTDIQTQPARGGGNLTTLVTVAVEEAWKGAPAGQITIAVQGGVAGDVAQGVSGELRFSPGERSILFLKTKGDRYTVVGRRQGKLIIKTGADGHEAAQDLTGAMKDIGRLRAAVKAAGR
jgi:hypothetical protein